MNPVPVAPARRLHCTHCLRPSVACICAWIAVVPHCVEVLVLQHPQEVAHAKGSARLLHLSLPRSRLVTGEVFDPTSLQALLTQSGRRPVLLYPYSPHDRALGIQEPPVLDSAWQHHPAQLRLVVLDGTWRKSRKMLYGNPLLQTLPRLSLTDMPASHYRIRKAHKSNQLSTLEATCAALAYLEGNATAFQPLLAAFDGFVTALARMQRSPK
jgi:DTW domain-containing protein